MNMKDIRTKNLFTRLLACIMIFAMCIGFVTVPAFADAVEDYEYTVNYTMTDPVLKGNGAKLYWSDMTEGGYEIADEGEELTKDGENFTTCIDVDSAEGWYEVDSTPKSKTRIV